MKTLVKLALVVGAVAVAAKLVAAKKAEWQGLSESEVRAKVGSRLPGRVPDEKRGEIADKVVAKMRARGAFDEEAPATPGAADDAATEDQDAAAASDAGSEEDTESA